MPKKEGMSNREMQLALIENFVNLQKVLTNLTVKFDILSDNINRLLQLFEISAKSFVRKNETSTSMGTEDKEFISKIDAMLDQNKTIAKGLTLMEEKLRHKMYQGNQAIRPIPRPNLNPHNDIGKEEREQRLKTKPLPRI